MAWRVRVGFLFFALFGLIAAGLFVYVGTKPRINILLITLDTTRADRLGCYGAARARTPTLDRLAEQGILFERAYAPIPLTLPSHASMLTGLYPPEHGLRNNGQGALPQGLPTLTTRLKEEGYDTGAFLAAFVLNQKFGLNRDFDEYDDDLSQADPRLDGHHQYREGSLVIDSAIDWLRRRNRSPFFCWVHLFDPHYPYLAHEDLFGSEFQDRPYDAELAYVDLQIERLLAELKKSGQLENTMIVIVGDHGESLGEHGELSHGMTLYDATQRVPFLIVSPGEGVPGTRVKEPVSLVDLTPTLLDRLGIPPLPNVSGRSLRDSMSGKPIAPRPCYAETDEPYHVGHWSPLRAIITAQWKYIRTPQPELYDLLADPAELKNLATSSQDQLQTLDEELTELEKGMEQRIAGNVALSEQDRRALSGLGYASVRTSNGEKPQQLRDVKEMLPYYYKLNDASTMMDVGRHDLAEPILREVLAADDGFFAAHAELGRCLLKKNQLPEALKSLKRAMELEPGSDKVQSMLAAVLLMQKDYAAAVEALELAIRLNPDLYQNHYNLGMALEKLGRPDEAISHYRDCLDLAPNSIEARQRLDFLRNR